MKHSTDEKILALIAHLGFLFGGLGFLIGPLIGIYFKKDSKFVAHHARQALAWQLGTLLLGLILSVCGFVFSFMTVGLGLFLVVPAIIILSLLLVIPSIIASFKVFNDEEYFYPWTGPYGEKL